MSSSVVGCLFSKIEKTALIEFSILTFGHLLQKKDLKKLKPIEVFMDLYFI
jgi:hypothetical protein